MTVPDAQRHYRWNFSLWVSETAAWMFATAFIDSTTVLPVLILSLSDSPFLASLILSARYAGQGWPQLVAASLVSGKPTRKRFYMLAAIPGRALLLWPAIVLLLGIRNPAFTVTAVLVAYFAFWVSEGFSLVPWTDMVGKTIPSRRRGRLFALMHVVGGILGVLAGVIVRQVLTESHLPFTRGYGMLFVFATAALFVSATSILLLREPPSPAHEERYSTLALIKDIPNLLRTMPQFRLLIILQALVGFSVLPAPFYILFATQFLNDGALSSGSSLGVGFFLAFQTGGMIVGNAVWGYIGDHFGNRLLLRVLTVAHTFVPLFAVLAGGIARTHPPLWAVYLAFVPVFFLYGGLLGGTWMGVTNFLLELAPEHDRPAYIAVMNALNIPAIILPMIGGLLLRVLGYNTIFLTAAVFLLYAVILTRRLQEPRASLAHHHHPPPEPWT